MWSGAMVATGIWIPCVSGAFWCLVWMFSPCLCVFLIQTTDLHLGDKSLWSGQFSLVLCECLSMVVFVCLPCVDLVDVSVMTLSLELFSLSQLKNTPKNQCSFTRLQRWYWLVMKLFLGSFKPANITKNRFHFWFQHTRLFCFSKTRSTSTAFRCLWLRVSRCLQVSLTEEKQVPSGVFDWGEASVWILRLV